MPGPKGHPAGGSVRRTNAGPHRPLRAGDFDFRATTPSPAFARVLAAPQSSVPKPQPPITSPPSPILSPLPRPLVRARQGPAFRQLGRDSIDGVWNLDHRGSASSPCAHWGNGSDSLRGGWERSLGRTWARHGERARSGMGWTRVGGRFRTGQNRGSAMTDGRRSPIFYSEQHTFR